MQVTDKIRSQMGSWVELFTPFIQSEQWDKIFTTLKTLSMNKRIVIPKSSDVFKSFELCDRQKVKAIIWLMDPYPSTTKEGEIIADGVPMSCKGKSRLQPTLEQWYGGIEEDCGGTGESVIGFIPDMDRSGDIDFLLTEEGVLLLNSCLTCELNKPGSHVELWTPFMKFFIEEIVSNYYKGLPIVLCGAQAQKLEKFINPMLHYVKKIEHPVSGSYANRAWDHQNCFKWVDEIIRQNNGESQVPRWWRKKGEDTIAQESVKDWLKPNEDDFHGDLPWQKK